MKTEKCIHTETVRAQCARSNTTLQEIVTDLRKKAAFQTQGEDPLLKKFTINTRRICEPFEIFFIIYLLIIYLLIGDRV